MLSSYKLRAAFTGRLGRLKYFLFSFPLSILILYFSDLSTNLFVYTLFNNKLQSEYFNFWIGLIIISMFLVLLIKTCLTVKRLHDLNMSGWLALTTLLLCTPMRGFYIFIYIFLIFAPGNRGTNKYGNYLWSTPSKLDFYALPLNINIQRWFYV